MSQIGRFTSGAAKESLQHLLKSGGGSLLITSGLRDLRFSVAADEVTLEAVGYSLGEPPDLVREFLAALFWEDPSFILSPPGALERHAQGSVVHVKDIEVRELVGELLEGCTELGQLREQVPGMEAMVTVKGEAPPPDVAEPSAQLFRALDGLGSQRGGILSQAAEEAGLDPIDAAWITSELVESGQAEVKPTPAPLVARRLKRVEGLVGAGFSRGLRYAHLGRAHAKADGRRAAHFQRLAGQAYLSEGKAAQAIAAYRSCLAVQAEDIASSEGMITAYEKCGKGGDAKRLRKDVTRLYLQWGMPGRAREHMEVLGEKSFEQRNLLLECMLRMRDFQSAIELAEGLVSTMPEQGKAALASRFIEAGASGSPCERAVVLSGFKSSGGLRGLLWLLLLASLLGAALVGGEVYLRLEFQKAATVSRERLEAGEFGPAREAFGKLQELLGKLGGNAPPVSCLAQISPALAEIDGLEADTALVASRASVLRWREAGHTLEAQKLLSELRAEAKSPGLEALIDAKLAEVKAYRAKVSEQVESLGQKVISGKLEEALEKGREIREAHPDAKDIWLSSEIGVRLEVRTTAGSEPKLTVAGQSRVLSPDQDRPGSWEGEVRLPLDPEALTLVVLSSPNHVERKLELHFDDSLVSANLDLLLVEVKTDRDAKPPVGTESPGLFVVEDEQALVYAGRLQEGELEVEDSTPLFEALSELVGSDQRFVVYLRSEVKFGRFAFTGLELFLSDVVTGAKATPRAVALSPLGEVTRSFDEQDNGRILVPNLSVVDDLTAVVDGVRATLADMQRELR